MRDGCTENAYIQRKEMIDGKEQYVQQYQQYVQPYVFCVAIWLALFVTFCLLHLTEIITAVIMCGLVKCEDDPEFYAGEVHGSYKRTGATEVTGLSLTKVQQLLRYLHLSDNVAEMHPRASKKYTFSYCQKSTNIRVVDTYCRLFLIAN